MTDALARQQVTPIMDMVARAVEAGNLEMVKELYAFQRQIDADNALQAFNAAFTAFKKSAIRVIKDKENTQYSKGEKKAMYTSLGRLVETVTPFLSLNDLSHAWEIDQSNGIKVTCVLSHTLGHSKRDSVTFPADKSGAKNPLQEIKSAITYGKAATFESVCGLASTDANLDDDGNGATPRANAVPDEKFIERMELIENANDEKTLQAAYFDAVKEARGIGDKDSERRYAKAKDKRKAELV